MDRWVVCDCMYVCECMCWVLFVVHGVWVRKIHNFNGYNYVTVVSNSVAEKCVWYWGIQKIRVEPATRSAVATWSTQDWWQTCSCCCPIIRVHKQGKGSFNCNSLRRFWDSNSQLGHSITLKDWHICLNITHCDLCKLNNVIRGYSRTRPLKYR